MIKNKKMLILYILFSIIVAIQLVMIVLRGTGLIECDWLLVFMPMLLSILFSCLASVLFLVMYLICETLFLLGHDDWED